MSGFVADPGTDFGSGSEPELARRLDALGKRLGVTVYGISGARTPAHSVAVGGFANDPHTQAKAADIGVGSQLRASAGQVPESVLNAFGLTRPFAGASEVNHVQLLDPGAKKLPGAAAATSKAPSAPGLLQAAADTVTQGPAAGASDVASGLWAQAEPLAAYAFLAVVLVLGGAALLFTGGRRLFAGQAVPA